MATQVVTQESTPLQKFQHIPFDNAKEQIRLLCFIPEDSKATRMRLTLSTWNQSEAPTYNAISYTWGSDTHQHRVEIDGNPFTVRCNCFAALSKVRLHYPHDPVWIDSICNNQTDDAEKIAQVAMIYDIFCGATRVLACLGDLYMVRDFTDLENANRLDDPHWNRPVVFARDLAAPTLDGDELAKILCQSAAALEPRIRELTSHGDTFQEFPNGRSYDDFKADIQLWVDSLSSSLGMALRHGLWSFFSQEYWKRLWIVPEIEAAGDDLELLIGSVKMNSLHVHFLRVLVEGTEEGLNISNIWIERNPPKMVFDGPYSGKISRDCANALTRLNRKSLSSALDKSRGRLCSDPRDRVYAFHALMKAHLPFQLDYRKSRLELATETFLCIYEEEQQFVEHLELIAIPLEIAEDDLARVLGLDGTFDNEQKIIEEEILRVYLGKPRGTKHSAYRRAAKRCTGEAKPMHKKRSFSSFASSELTAPGPEGTPIKSRRKSNTREMDALPVDQLDRPQILLGALENVIYGCHPPDLTCQQGSEIRLSAAGSQSVRLGMMQDLHTCLEIYR